MVKINPKDYGYLWTDHEVNFIFVSCYLFKNFKETDFVLIYEPEKNGVTFFLAKEAKKACAEYGIQFYEKKFEEWKRKVETQVMEGKRIITETKVERRKIPSMNDQIIKQKFLERVKLFQELGNLYFYTEFFFLEKVEQQLKQKKKNEILQRNVQEMGKIKLEAREVLNEFYNYKRIFQPYIEEIGKRRKRNDLPWLSFEEISAVIEGKKVPITQREKETWILTKRNHWKLILGKEAEKMKDNFNAYFFSKTVESVKGMIANKGKYIGRVKILRTIFSDRVQEEIKKVKKGDILVANTTGPEVMSACERAGAIVTDEGGITSHAAIVSRELKIPCIVGTKSASHIFKDDDLVEVDANTGIVKKIKSNC